MCRRPTRSGTGTPRLARSPGSDVSSSRSGSLVIDWESLTAKFHSYDKRKPTPDGASVSPAAGEEGNGSVRAPENTPALASR